MAAMVFDEQVYNREVPFCRVYSKDSKDKLEKIFLQNRISYFIEWQERSFLARLFGSEEKGQKTIFIIRINEADVDKATELVQGMDSVKLKKQKETKEE